MDHGRDHSNFIDITDEYVEWLCYINATPGFHPGHLYVFDYAIKNLPCDAPLIEIGSFCGLSTNLLTYYKTKNNIHNTLITCDKWEFENAHYGRRIGESDISFDEYSRFVKESYINNVKMFSSNDLPYTIEATSDDFFSLWEKSAKINDVFGRSIQLGGLISFCYIDGNHTYEYVKRDFHHCDRYLIKGGFCFFDDSSDDSQFHGVRRLIREVKDQYNYDIALKNPHYLFRKM